MPKQQSFDKKLKSFVTSTLRRASLRWPARSEALRNARTSRGLYQCSMCGGQFKAKEIDIDHTVPVVSTASGFTNWDDFINRLFVPAEKLSALCKPCHLSKTLLEDRTRANINAIKKGEQAEIIKAAKKSNKDDK